MVINVQGWSWKQPYHIQKGVYLSIFLKFTKTTRKLIFLHLKGIKIQSYLNKKSLISSGTADVVSSHSRAEQAVVSLLFSNVICLRIASISAIILDEDLLEYALLRSFNHCFNI